MGIFLWLTENLGNIILGCGILVVVVNVILGMLSELKDSIASFKSKD
jgi:multisubunit Na+/H+ antiporter MnhC subunit